MDLDEYESYDGPGGRDPRTASLATVSEGLIRIIAIEGPVVAKRAYDIYLRSCGIKRMGHDLKHTMNKALSRSIAEGLLVAEDERAKGGVIYSVVRTPGTSPIRLRDRGQRDLEEIPPSELQVVARRIALRHDMEFGTDEHLRAVLECFDLKRLTTQVRKTLEDSLSGSYPYADDFI